MELSIDRIAMLWYHTVVMEKLTEFQCPARGDHCERCCEIARDAMLGSFLGEYGEKGDQVLAENIPIKTVVNTPGVGILTCEQRQRRAREVGAEIAKEYTVR